MSVETQEKVREIENKLGLDMLGDKPILKLDNDGEFLFIEKGDEEALDNKLMEIKDYISNNDGKGKTDEEKDKFYSEAQTMYKETLSLLADTEFNLFLNRPQYKFMHDLITKNLTYNIDTIFFGIDLADTMIQMQNLANYSDDKGMGKFPFTATDVTYTYHLLKDHTVKGLGTKTFTFANILRRIADVSKVFKYYDNAIKDAHKDITDWVTCFDDGMSKEVPVNSLPASE